MKIDANTNVTAMMGDISLSERAVLAEGDEATKRGSIARKQRKAARDIVMTRADQQAEKLRKMADMTLGSTLLQAGVQVAQGALSIAGGISDAKPKDEGWFGGLIKPSEPVKKGFSVAEVIGLATAIAKEADGFAVSRANHEADKKVLENQEKQKQYAVDAADEHVDHLQKIANEASDRQNRMAQLIHQGQMAVIRG
jgi:hypothetical protein